MKNDSFRRINFIASENRESPSIVLHPDLLHGLRKIAKQEKKSVSWLVETALSDYFGVEVLLRKLKNDPKPAYRMRDNIRFKKRIA